MDAGMTVTTESGRTGVAFALRSGPDGLFAKVGSLAAGWERVTLPDQPKSKKVAVFSRTAAKIDALNNADDEIRGA